MKTISSETYSTPETNAIPLAYDEPIAATSGSFGGYDEGDFDWN